MSDDPDIERFIQRVRPAGPDASLRTRILSDLRDVHAWPWVAAAAALFGISFALHGATARLESAGPNRLDTLAIDARLEHAMQALGGDPTSRALATFIVTGDDLARQARGMEVQP